MSDSIQPQLDFINEIRKDLNRSSVLSKDFVSDVISWLREMAYISHQAGKKEAKAELEADAIRWRKLMSCGRIKMMGGTGSPGNQLIGMEFWDKYPIEKLQAAGISDDSSKEKFIAFVDSIEL